MYLLADALQFCHKGRALDARQNQQKFVAAVTDEGVAFADAAAHNVDGGLQRHVARVVAVGVVVQFKIVEVEHRHTGGLGLVFYHVLEIAAVVAAGQCVVVELGMVARDAVR